MLLNPASSTTSKHRVTKIVPERLRVAQRFCGTEKFYSEEAQTSPYEQPKHHEYHAPAHTAKAMHRSNDALGYS